MKIAQIIFSALLALPGAVAIAQSLDPNVPMRPSLYGNAVDKEAWNRQILIKGQPASPLVKNLHPSFNDRDTRVLNAVKVKGDLKTAEHGVFEIDNKHIIAINVDWRDRGYVKEAAKFLAKFEGKPVEAICQVRLVNGPMVCDIYATEKGEDINLSAELLRNGWYGWQTEVGGARSPEAGRAATEAYWNYRGVWSNKWYFPDASFRNAYAKITIK